MTDRQKKVSRGNPLQQLETTPSVRRHYANPLNALRSYASAFADFPVRVCTSTLDSQAFDPSEKLLTNNSCRCAERSFWQSATQSSMILQVRCSFLLPQAARTHGHEQSSSESAGAYLPPLKAGMLHFLHRPRSAGSRGKRRQSRERHLSGVKTQVQGFENMFGFKFFQSSGMSKDWWRTWKDGFC